MTINYDKRYFIITTIILSITIILSTIAHHIFLWIFKLPNVIGSYTIEPIWLDLLTMIWAQHLYQF